MMLDPVKEALWFYTAADYLIINAFLWKNTKAMAPCLEIVHKNNVGMIREAEEQTPEKRFSFSGLDCQALLDSYKRRTPRDLSPTSRRRMLEQAIADIRLLYRSASPAQQEMLLFRNMDARFMLNGASPGNTVELLGLTSTSSTGQLIDYGHQDYRAPAQVLKIHVPVGMPVLRFENAENEVILPPMSYQVVASAVHDSIPTVGLKAHRVLDIENLISSAKDTFSSYFAQE